MSIVCYACGSTRLRVRKFPNGSISFCETCGLGTRAAARPKEGLYSGDYYSRSMGGIAGIYQQLLTSLEKKQISRLMGGKGRILDIGCGDGGFLRSLETLKGVERYGIEVSKDGFRKAEELARGRIRLFPRPLEECRFPDAHFQVITLRHVLEHVHYPAPLLQEAYRVLAPGGTLLIRVPNIASAEAQLSMGSWLHLDIEHHCYYFTPKSLRLLLRRAGFPDIRVSHFSPEYKHVMVYSIMDRAGIRIRPLRLAGMAMMLPFAIAISWLAAALGKSGTIEAHGKKPAA